MLVCMYASDLETLIKCLSYLILSFKIELQNQFEPLFLQEEEEEEGEEEEELRNVNGDGGEQAQDVDINVQ